MRLLAPLLFLIFAASLPADGPKGDLALRTQIQRLEKLGAKVTLDEKARVTAVHLGERKVTDADLALLKGFRHLRELDLTRTRVTSAGLAHLKESTALRTLFLTDTKVDDSGVEHLKGLKALELVGLSGTKVGDSGLGHLHGLAGLRKVFCLGTGVTDEGEKALRRALPKCSVTR